MLLLGPNRHCQRQHHRRLPTVGPSAQPAQTSDEYHIKNAGSITNHLAPVFISVIANYFATVLIATVVDVAGQCRATLFAICGVQSGFFTDCRQGVVSNQGERGLVVQWRPIPSTMARQKCARSVSSRLRPPLLEQEVKAKLLRYEID